MALAAIIFAVFALLISAYLVSETTIKRHGKALRYFSHSGIRIYGSITLISSRRPPNYLPFIGNGLLFLQDRDKLLSWFAKCERLFGFETFAIRVPTLPPGIVINDPANLEYVLKSVAIFSKGNFFKRRSKDLFGDGIINADGELWKVQRKAGLQFLNNANLKILTEKKLPKLLDEMTERLRASNGELIDMAAVIEELSTQLMGDMAYDMEMHADDSFARSFDYASGCTGSRFQNPLWQLTEPIFSSKFRRAVSEVKRFGREIVDSAVASQKFQLDQHDGDGGSGSLIHSLLELIDDPEVVADAALNYLSAGRDTISQALTWTLDQLLRDPKSYDKIRHEAQGLQPRDMIPAKMPFTMASFYEGLRLYPPVPFEIRQCQEPTTLPDGTVLPQDTIVFWSIWSMNRSHLIWGADSEHFRPGRWLDDKGNLLTKTAFEFPVFNGGPRMCLGKKMAEAIAVMVLGVLCLDFDIVPTVTQERKSKNSLTLPMEGGLPCYLTCSSRSDG